MLDKTLMELAVGPAGSVVILLFILWQTYVRDDKRETAYTVREEKLHSLLGSKLDDINSTLKDMSKTLNDHAIEIELLKHDRTNKGD